MTTQATKTFISCDWGTSNFRLRLIADGARPFQVLAEVRSEDGIAQMRDRLQSGSENGESIAHEVIDSAFRGILGIYFKELEKQFEAPLLAQPIVISGMASSSIGWRELDYAKLPIPISASAMTSQTLPPLQYESQAYPITIISGLATDKDVMRGEETELLGLLSRAESRPHLNKSTVIMPGTHSKHITIQDEHIVNFNTFMTGESFAIYQGHSVLKHSLNDSEPQSFDEHSFVEGVKRAASPEGILGNLFQIRSLSLLQGRTANQNLNYLSGLLIGAELLSLQAQPPEALLIAAPPALLNCYLLALGTLEIAPAYTFEDLHLLSSEGQSLFIH